jgi:hypothetical protein
MTPPIVVGIFFAASASLRGISNAEHAKTAKEDRSGITDVFIRAFVAIFCPRKFATNARIDPNLCVLCIFA